MSNPPVFQSVNPMGDTDVNALPVKEFGPAIGYYTQVLGFRLVEKQNEKVILQRDDVKIGLALNGNDPEQASCYFAVSNVEALRQELLEKGIEPSEMRVDNYNGTKYRIFFAKEPYGVCFCFGQPE